MCFPTVSHSGLEDYFRRWSTAKMWSRTRHIWAFHAAPVQLERRLKLDQTEYAANCWSIWPEFSHRLKNAEWLPLHSSRQSLANDKRFERKVAVFVGSHMHVRWAASETVSQRLIVMPEAFLFHSVSKWCYQGFGIQARDIDSSREIWKLVQQNVDFVSIGQPDLFTNENWRLCLTNVSPPGCTANWQHETQILQSLGTFPLPFMFCSCKINSFKTSSALGTLSLVSPKDAEFS
jgi:hypothetical protein